MDLPPFLTVPAAANPAAPMSQHLPHGLASQPELPGRLALTHLTDDNRSPHPRIQLHCVHLSGVAQNANVRWNRFPSDLLLAPPSNNAVHAGFSGLF